MARIAAALQRLSLKPSDISARARIPLSRAEEILNGDLVTPAELRALSRGLKLPLKAFTSAQAADRQLAPRFRSPGADQSEREPTLERLTIC